MPLLMIDGFERYRSNSGATNYVFDDTYNMLGIVTSSQNVALTTGRVAGFAATAGGGGNPTFFRTIFAAPVEGVIGFAIKIVNSRQFLSIHEYDFGGPTDYPGFSLSTDGSGEIVVKFAGSTLATTTGVDISDWAYVEFKYKIDATTGYFDLHVDGVSEASGTGLNTVAFDGSPLFTQWGNTTDNSFGGFFDDMYALFIDGGGINDDFLGPQLVEGIHPTADGATTNWTTSAGSDHYLLVNETFPDDDATYVSTSATNQELFEFGDLTYITTPHGINISAVAAKNGASGVTTNFIIKPSGGSVTSFGFNFTPSSIVYSDQVGFVYDHNPDGNVDFTDTVINGAQFGFEVQ